MRLLRGIPLLFLPPLLDAAIDAAQIARPEQE